MNKNINSYAEINPLKVGSLYKFYGWQNETTQGNIRKKWISKCEDHHRRIESEKATTKDVSDNMNTYVLTGDIFLVIELLSFNVIKILYKDIVGYIVAFNKDLYEEL